MTDTLHPRTPPDAATKRRGKKRPLSIADGIKDWIVVQGLKPGDRLPGERELIERFQASKGTIREALQVLETQGLVRSRTGPGGGTFVGAQSEAKAMELLGNYFFFRNPTIGDIYALRRILEPELAASVAGRLGEADFRRLELTMQIYVEPPRDLEEERHQRHAELDFHGILVDYCPNPVLAFMCRFLQSLLRELTVCRRIYDEPNPDLRETGLSYQVRLLRALRREDAAAAREIMSEHMRAAQRYMEEREAVLQARFLQVSD
jgi:GntR family transcriptional regulator, transcriptional repressor for pyruvate dehydrogenase complex